MRKHGLDLKKLYKLPWSTYNNPNGWIEPTTFCQLACPGCYRGLALSNPVRTHEDSLKLKKEIDTLIKVRKIKILSIAGGEPLLYPKLNELVSYATSKGLKSRLVTNGAGLTVKRLTELKRLGVTEMAIHIAHYQNRGKFANEAAVNILRGKYCQMFRKVGGIQLDFIMTVSKENFSQLPTIIDFYKKNSGIIGRVIFTIFRDFFFKTFGEENSKNYVTAESLINLIRKKYKVEPCAYLGKKFDKNASSWLFFAPILLNGKTIGFANGKTVERLHEKENNNTWTSFPAGETNLLNIFRSLFYFSLANLKQIATNYLKQFFTNPRNLLKFPKCQIIILINTPKFTKLGWDLCDGCPDAILYNGKLVPSCLLERIKMGENITL
jgi:hypothetical protein